ncbi:MAG: Glycine/sarcosine/betaine reductase complex component A1 [Firmicutes bacterium ADurb.Bin506]|jgi:glycine reductase|nr:MAG: Glycine/sarcosine/betaine reductase complex component A1 [Firmicutes bacterium ADurb.Bin506]
MDLENQARVKELAEKYGPENVVVVIGGAEAEASGLTAETVTAGDPTYAGPLAGVQLGLSVWHIVEDELKQEIDPAVYEDQVSMMEMVLDVDAIKQEVSSIRQQYSKY